MTGSWEAGIFSVNMNLCPDFLHYFAACCTWLLTKVHVSANTGKTVFRKILLVSFRDRS